MFTNYLCIINFLLNNMNNNFYLLFILLLLLLIIFIAKEIKKRNRNPKDNFQNYLYNLSLLFDDIYKDANKKKNCPIEESIINNKRENMTDYLGKIVDYRFLDPEIIIMNRNQCLKFNGDRDYKVEKTEKNSFCQDIWRQVNNNIGFMLEYRLIKTYLNKNRLFLYKRYNCGSKDTQLIIGVSAMQR